MWRRRSVLWLNCFGQNSHLYGLSVQSGSMSGVDKEQIESVLGELTKKIADED